MAIHAVVRTYPTRYDRGLCGGMQSPAVKLFEATDWQEYLRRPDACPACRDSLVVYDWHSGWCGICRDGEQVFCDYIRVCRRHDPYATPAYIVVHARVPTHPIQYSHTQCGSLSPSVDLFDAGDWAAYQWRSYACTACKNRLSTYDWSSGWCDASRDYDGSFFIVRLCREHDQYQKASARANIEHLMQWAQEASSNID